MSSLQATTGAMLLLCLFCTDSRVAFAGPQKSAANAEEVTLRPFASDGCSVFPDGTLSQQELWLACCEAHDLAYWRGGSYQERLVADHELSQCVEQSGQPEIASLMLAGVRVGGSPLWPTPFRWGYGWPYYRGYGELSSFEQKQLNEALYAQRAGIALNASGVGLLVLLLALGGGLLALARLLFRRLAVFKRRG